MLRWLGPQGSGQGLQVVGNQGSQVGSENYVKEGTENGALGQSKWRRNPPGPSGTTMKERSCRNEVSQPRIFPERVLADVDGHLTDAETWLILS